jgi:polynucleotide 5'-kinase involved in rRNA processing
LPEEKINRFFFNSDLVKVEIGQNRKFPQGAYVFYGEFVEHSSEELILHQEPTKIGIYTYIDASDREFTARKTAFVAIPKEAIEIKQTMEEMEIKIE